MSTNPKCDNCDEWAKQHAELARELNQQTHWLNGNPLVKQLQERVSELEAGQRQQLLLHNAECAGLESQVRDCRRDILTHFERITSLEHERDALAEQLKLSEYNADGLREAKRGLFNSFQDMREQLKLAMDAIENAPHEDDCAEKCDRLRPCNCWKRDALARLSGG